MASKRNQEAFKYFRGWVPQQRITVDSSSDKSWKFYDYGPKEVSPVVFIPGASGTAEIFFKQFLSLCPKGYRLISVQFPDYVTHESWCKGFEKFLDKLKIDKIHICGTSVGGYLAQCFVQYRPHRCLSMVLNNSFADTQFYKDNAPCAGMFPVMPEFVLKRMLLQNFPTGELEEEIAASIDFMVQQLDTLTQRELSSRLTLNCTLSDLKPAELPYDKTKITIIDSIDEVAVPEKLRDELYKLYPEAKLAELKHGGNFPYISNADEFNMYLEIHLRKHGLDLRPKVEQEPEDIIVEETKEETESKQEENE